MRETAAACERGGAWAAARRRAVAADGYTLSEMLVVLVILVIVLGALTTLFVSASRAQLDMSRRVEAQHNARLALDKLRREIHCASSVRDMNGAVLATGSFYSGLRITLGSYCPTAGGSSVTITWCTTTTSGVSKLYRVVGAAASCSGGVKTAEFLVKPTGQDFFSLVPPAGAGERTAIRVNLPVVVNGPRYTLTDDIALRNSPRS